MVGRENESSHNRGAERPALAELAYRSLKRDILTCQLAPGARVSEQVLADRLGLGKAPIRTALAQLRRDGLVVSVPQVGYEIAQVTLRDAAELFDTREVLEVACVRRAAVLVTQEHLERLDALAKVECHIGDRASVEAYLRANDEFHRLLATASGNSYLAGLLFTTLERLDRILHLGHLLTASLGIENDGRHAELVARLRARDDGGAITVLIAHLGMARQRAFAALLDNPAIQNVNLGVV